MLNLKNSVLWLGCSALVLGSGVSVGAEIVPESRDSVIEMIIANFGFTPGYVGGGEGPVIVTETGTSTGDNLFLDGGLFYGPDGFGRINNGTYDASQELTVSSSELLFDAYSAASVAGDASPFLNIENESSYYFSVDQTTTASVSVIFEGNTNVGNDAVGMHIRRVGPGMDPDVLETLFTIAVFPSGSGDVGDEIELIAGERYLLFVSAKARSLNNSGPFDSFVNVSIELPPCPADLNGDGSLNFFDVSMFLSAFNAQDPSADFTGDGMFNFFDVSAFLSAFNSGCP